MPVCLDHASDYGLRRFGDYVCLRTVCRHSKNIREYLREIMISLNVLALKFSLHFLSWCAADWNIRYLDQAA